MSGSIALYQNFNDRLLLYEVEAKYGKSGDPERMPNREPGDGFVLLGALIGFITGGVALGMLGARLYGNAVAAALGFTVGGIGGGIFGSIIGIYVKKIAWRREYPRISSGNKSGSA